MDIGKCLIKIYICGKIDDSIVENIFPVVCLEKLNGELIGDRQLKAEDKFWVAKLYKDNNIDSIYKEIQKDSDLNKIKKNIILSFGDENSEALFKKLLEIGIVYLPRFIFITKKEGNYNFKKKMFISNIIYTGTKEKELISNIMSELWEIDCYYNERGNTTAKYLPTNILDRMEVNDVSINILLAGISRAGKSSFINIVSEKLVALENCEKSSITSKISEYQIFLKNKSGKDGFIKIIDTPGFNYETKNNNSEGKLVNLEQINQEIFNLINEFRKKSSGEDIHFVLFFFLEGTPLQGTQNILKLFMEEHYKVLFIINKAINDDDEEGETSDIKSTLKFLRDNHLQELAIRDNIIPCNLIDSKRLKGYGIDIIFERIFNLLIENNKFYNNDDLWRQIKDCNDQIFKYYNIEGKEMEYKQYLNESIKLKKLITLKNELFKKYEGEENIIEEGKKKAEYYKSLYIGLATSQSLIPIPYSDLALTPVLQAQMIYLILSGYGVSLVDNFEMLKEFLIGGTVRELGHYGVNLASKKIFSFTAKGCLVQLGKILLAEQGSKTATESLKFIPFFGYLIGATVGAGINYYFTKDLADKSIKFCEYYLRKKGCLEFIMNRIEIYSNIFNEFKRLSEKKNWWDYKVKVIKKADINEN